MQTSRAAAATLVLLTVASPAWAQTVEQDGAGDEYSVATERAQTVFLDYQMSIDAEADCRQMVFSADDRMALDRAIAQQMVAESPNVSLGAGRLLNARRVAADQMDRLVAREGCDGQTVKKSLAFYEERLANVHPVPEPPLPGPQGDHARPVFEQTQSMPFDTAPQSLVPAAQP
jgi:hypothetical protein